MNSEPYLFQVLDSDVVLAFVVIDEGDHFTAVVDKKLGCNNFPKEETYKVGNIIGKQTHCHYIGNVFALK